MSSFNVCAQVVQQMDSLIANKLEEVVITGQINPQSISKSIVEVKVITREDIERQAGNTLADVLNTTLNINVTPNTSTGKSGISLFGLDGQYFKVLIDNIPIINEEGLGNNTDLSLINLDDIARIEIVEGAMGVQYGSNAVSGIINIITKKSSRNDWEIITSLQEETVGNEYEWFNMGRHIQSLKVGHNLTQNVYLNGDINKTAIAPVSSNDLENKVYLINLGYKVGTETPAPGSQAVAGDARGWKKIRILKQDGAYLFQYADLNQSTHQEVLIEKDSNFNFSFFSFDTNSKLAVEPQAENWDVNFTVFTNVLTGAGSYGFSDGVLHNRKGGVKVYSILTDEIAYDDFSIENINTSAFLLDQRTIGSSWREVITQDKVLVDNIYYIIQDPNDNIYKLKFTALLSDSGERGFPEFKYKLVQ